MEIEPIEEEFSWARGLTRTLLMHSSPSDLDFSLGQSGGPLWKQFRHIARVHENYLSAIETGSVDFTTEGGAYGGGSSKSALLDYFDEVSRQHGSLIPGCDATATIDWFGEPIPLATHLLRLVTHETLHHGQLILYWRALGNPFPEGWQVWGE